MLLRFCGLLWFFTIIWYWSTILWWTTTYAALWGFPEWIAAKLYSLYTVIIFVGLVKAHLIWCDQFDGGRLIKSSKSFFFHVDFVQQ